MQDDPDLRRLLWNLLGATRGGEMRARLIHQIRSKPGTVNQLSNRLNVGYRTVMHHVEVLKRNSLVVTAGEQYGLTYFLHPWLESHIDIFDEVCRKLRFELA